MDDLERVMGALRPEVTIDGWRATACYRPQPEHRGNPGWLHGGLAAYVLDHVCARAAAAALGGRVVTATIELRYPRPVPLDAGPYLVQAEAAEPKRRLVRVTGAIVDSGGRPMVEAKALFVLRPPIAG